MCEKITGKYPNHQIDECIRDEIAYIIIKTSNIIPIMSCCGHGKYHKSFVVKVKETNEYCDFYSGIILHGLNKRRDSRKPFYKRDKQGYYFIPELEAYYKQQEES